MSFAGSPPAYLLWKKSGCFFALTLLNCVLKSYDPCPSRKNMPYVLKFKLTGWGTGPKCNWYLDPGLRGQGFLMRKMWKHFYGRPQKSPVVKNIRLQFIELSFTLKLRHQIPEWIRCEKKNISKDLKWSKHTTCCSAKLSRTIRLVFSDLAWLSWLCRFWTAWVSALLQDICNKPAICICKYSMKWITRSKFTLIFLIVLHLVYLEGYWHVSGWILVKFIFLQRSVHASE